MSLENFWPNQNQISECIQWEAEVPPAAVLLAVHRPMDFQLIEKSKRTPVKEERLLEKFLDPEVERGTALLVIRGSNGVGKSHAIRWLEAKLRARAESISQHIIVLPKSTSLKGAINLILADLNGSRFEPLRERLKGARDYLDFKDAAIQLKANLETVIDRKVAEAISAGNSARARGEKASDENRKWKDHEALIGVITHPSLRERWVGMANNKPKGVLAEIASHVLKDGLIIDENTRLQFKQEDLTFEAEELQDVAGKERRYIQLLGSGNGQHRKDAIDLLNSVIDDAANQLLEIGDTGLKDLFDEIRQELKEEEKELVVLVEDFAVLSGMQGALLDALIKEAVSDGKRIRCTMRTAIAVTKGYTLPGTALDRITGDFEIEDIPFNDNESALNAIVDLVGGYLNAARVGRPALEAAYRTKGMLNQEWVPRFENMIELEESDRARLAAFGASQSAGGYSLFPFNRAVLGQLATLRFRKSEHGEDRIEFKPRDILKYVVRKTLIENGRDFRDKKFPPANYNEADSVNQLGRLVADEIRKLEPDTEKRGRLMALVRFWGNNPKSPNRADWKLLPAIPQAFGLREIAGLGEMGNLPVKTPVPGKTNKGAVIAKKEEKSGSSTPLVSQPQSELDRWRDIIDNWISGRTVTLPQAEALVLRKWIASDVLAAINWDMEFLPNPSGDILRRFREMVFLEKSAGTGDATEEECSVLAVSKNDLADPETQNEAGLALHALVCWKIEGTWSFDSDGRNYMRWISFIVSKRDRALDFLKEKYGKTLLAPATRALYLGTRLLDVPGAHSENPEEYVRAMFLKRPLTPDDAPMAAARMPESWESLRFVAVEQRERLQNFVLRFVGARTGGAGNSHAIDFPRLLSVLGDVREKLIVSDVQLPGADEADFKPAVEHAKKLRNHLQTALGKKAANCRERIVRCSGELGKSPAKERIRSELGELISKCSASLSISFDLCDRLRKATELFATSTYQTIEAPAPASSLSALLTFAVSVNEQDLSVTENFLDEFKQFSGAVESKLRLAAISGGLADLKSEQVEFQAELSKTAELVGATLSHGKHSDASEAPEKPGGKRGATTLPASVAPSDGACLLLLKCQQLAQGLRDHADQEKHKLKAESLRAHRQNIKSHREDLEKQLKPWKLLEARKVPGLVRPIAAAALRDGLNIIYGRVTQMSEQINAGQTVKDCLAGLTRIANDYELRAETAWKKYKESDFYVGVSIGLVKTFVGIEGFKVKASKLADAIEKELDPKLARIPQSDEEWKELEIAYKLCQRLINELPFGSLPEDVRTFLEGSVAGGAPLSSLTKDVMDWLRKHGLISSFVIRAASSISQSDRLF